MLSLLLTPLLFPVAAPQDPATPEPAPERTEPVQRADGWNAELAEHLLNRAGFGARPDEVERAVALGRAAFVDDLLERRVPRGEYFFENVAARRSERKMSEVIEFDAKAKREVRKRKRRSDDEQLSDYGAWWIERMLSGEDPLREKMTLFWHGHFATSQQTVKNSFEMIQQNELFYAHALGRFEDLLQGVVRDPAMLEYLDNDENKKSSPNENLARELMELFTLGEGNYSERDVQEAARTLTGWSDGGGKFRVIKKRHDDGDKTVLGRTGPFDGDDLVRILLEQPACGAFLAGKLLAWFEGVEPDPDRAGFYGDFLAANDYDVTAFLRRLFNDPAFYRDEIRGNRIAGPVEHLVSTSRRLGIEPPSRFLLASGTALGQRLFFPPSVKGWDGGEAWISTSSFMQRGNLAGVLLGVVDVDDIVNDYGPLEDEAQMDADAAPDAAMEPAGGGWGADPAASMDEMGDAVAMEDMQADAMEPQGSPSRKLGDLQALKGLRSMKWRPRINLTTRLAEAKKRKDGAMVRCLADELLALPLSKETRDFLVAELREKRRSQGIKNGQLLKKPEVAEPILRDLAHLMLSLPEAQLN
ncbi:MAG: DUF1800 domain-containing protein [Planctomycetota bacterium]